MKYQKTILKFLQSQDYCVLSTIDGNNHPHGATMAFSYTNNLHIIFSTSKKSQKYSNIIKNPQVAITWGWNPEVFTTVQYQGTMKPINKDLEYYQKLHITKNPSSKAYLKDTDNTYLIVYPTHIKYTNLKSNVLFSLDFAPPA